MPDRPVSLDLRTPSGQAQGDLAGGLPGGTARRAPDQDAVARFGQSLRADRPNEMAQGQPAPASGTPASPFSLFGRQAMTGPGGPLDGLAERAPEPAEAARAQVASLWDRSLQDTVRRLLVAEDQRSLRLDIDPSVFPGVVLEVFEDAGAWVAQFSCSDRGSYQRLAACAQEMAPRLADALARDSLWRVLGDAGDAQGLEAVEAFASAPGGGLR
jgi:hypothetical protein